ncbi:hypothetical protein ACEPPN_004652 [Leptodophora sp. 'Broadleaf-Isolate-01']
MKSHNEIDLDESPIVVLGCGYFLTAETLDGMIGMAEVYDIDSTPTNDHRVTVGGFAADLKSQSIILPNLSTVVQALRSNPAGSSFKIPGGNPAQHHTSFLRDCKTIIQDCTHANLPKLAVDNTLGLLGKEWNKEVTAEELAAIKQAMFVIGECGMPMEQDRCPECGAMIGGQHHRVVDGVTRATEME